MTTLNRAAQAAQAFDSRVWRLTHRHLAHRLDEISMAPWGRRRASRPGRTTLGRYARKPAPPAERV